MAHNQLRRELTSAITECVEAGFTDKMKALLERALIALGGPVKDSRPATTAIGSITPEDRALAPILTELAIDMPALLETDDEPSIADAILPADLLPALPTSMPPAACAQIDGIGLPDAWVKDIDPGDETPHPDAYTRHYGLPQEGHEG